MSQVNGTSKRGASRSRPRAQAQCERNWETPNFGYHRPTKVRLSAPTLSDMSGEMRALVGRVWGRNSAAGRDADVVLGATLRA